MMSFLIPVAGFGVDHRSGVGRLPRRFDINQTRDELIRG
jgi:hypothetical protein